MNKRTSFQIVDEFLILTRYGLCLTLDEARDLARRILKKLPDPPRTPDLGQAGKTDGTREVA